MVRQSKKTTVRKIRRKVRRGIVHIHAQLNNTIVTVTTKEGNVISWSSGGACGFKGARKGTPFAAQVAAGNAAQSAYDKGIRQVEIAVTGSGSGRETAIRGIYNVGLGIVLIRDITPISHNGCRPPKKRRV
jgi:small subunit ribosomal protein S11